jgi:uncharacterized protein YndB with AHSA1/START domain
MTLSASIEAAIDIHASPQRVFEVWSRVSEWPMWDPDTRSARLDGPLAVGSTGRLQPRKGLAVRLEVVRVEPQQRLDLRSPVLGSHLHFEHVLQPLASGCRVTHSVWFSGWLASLLMATVGRDVRQGLPVTMASLKRFVEAGR